jgi:hypothetical protein
MNKEQKLGSETAKNGFKNEKDIVSKFNNWENDNEAKKWLKLYGYKLIEDVLKGVRFIDGVRHAA